jgi:hypothetical protein
MNLYELTIMQRIKAKNAKEARLIFAGTIRDLSMTQIKKNSNLYILERGIKNDK